VIIEAVLFDIGGVILSSPFDAFNAYEAEVGLAPDTIRGLNATNPDTNAWARFERSELNPTQFCEVFESEAAAQGISVDAAAVLGCLAGKIRPRMVEVVRECSQRYRTAAVTNNFIASSGGSEHGGAVSLGDDIYPLFDAVIESRVVGYRKPDERFYRFALDALDVEASACVMLDDLGVNLKPARAMGMATIKVADPDVAIAALEEILGHPV
jgi:putative hydrolase of the HAD superfamily